MIKNYILKTTSIILFFFLICNFNSISSIPIDKNKHISEQQNTQTLDLNEKIITIINTVDQSTLEEYLTDLVELSPRYTGTEGCDNAAEYISDNFELNGLQTRYQYWSSFGNRYHPRFFESQNVEGTLSGRNSDKIIVFGAHYDTVQNTPGANDDGSGTVAVMTAAYVLSKFTFNHTLRFVTFSGEEIGLKGSWAYAEEAYKNNDHIILNINADMIGRATSYQTGHRMGFSITEDAIWLMDVLKSINSTMNLGFTFNQYNINRDGRGGSDYFPFTQYGWESIACWQGEGDPNMHTPDDDLDNVNFSYLVNTTKIIVGLLAYLADSNDFFPQIQIISPKHQSLYNHNMHLDYTNSQENTQTILFKEFSVVAKNNVNSMFPLERVEFYYDDILEFTDTSPPFKWDCERKSLGKHKITVVSYDRIGRKTVDYQNIFHFRLL